MKGQTTAVDLFYFAAGIAVVAAVMPVLVDAIGANWSEASLLLKSIYVAMPAVIVIGVINDVLASREIEAIIRDQKRETRRRGRR